MTIPSLKSLVGVDLAGPLMGIARRYAWTIPIVAGLGMVTSALESFGVGLLIPLLGLFSADLNAVSVPASLTFLLQIPAWFSDSHRLVALAGLIVLVIAVRSVLDFVNLALVVWLDGKAGHDIRLELADRLLRYGYGFFLQHNPMRLVNIVSTDSWRATEAIQIVFTMVAALGSVTVFSLFLIIIDWRLFLVLVLGEGAIRWLSSVIDKKLDPMSERVTGSNEVLGERMYLIAATLFKVIRIFRAERYELARFEAASDGTRRARLRIGILSSIVGPGLEVLQAILFVGILLGAHQGGIGLTVLVAFLLLARRTQPHLRSISEGYSHLATLAASVREVEWLLNPKDKPVGPRGSVPYRRLEREIRFDKVTFAYGPTPDQAPALIDASFAIAAGTATAVIGRSGSGKSTVVALLCRLIEPQAGAILVDGTSLSELEPSSWLDRLGVAGQDIELVDASVTENIAYGLEGISKDEIVRAATLADAHEFILRLPKGYDTPIGMRGLSLSGGQRQRIGIARALVRKPDILILDEATNAVDVISEAAVMSLIKARAGHSTTIVISHRQSTLELCETVVALQAGRAIAEFAKPREQREWASEHLL